MPQNLELSTVSVVVPVFNEEENVTELVRQIGEAMDRTPRPWELIVVDDGSCDGTLRILDEICAGHPHLRVLELQRNYGQTAAMQAGIDASRGDLVVTLDGDLQNDPADIPRLMDRLENEALDLLQGWRKQRKDGLILRKIPSRIANRLIGGITGVRLNDYGCSLKVYRGSVIRNVRLYGEMHRFIPAWMSRHTAPHRIAEEVVNHRPRVAGTSKYGISRIYRVLIDLMVVHFFLRFLSRPGHFFGPIGLTLGAIGSVILAYLMFDKFVLGESIGTRPLLTAGVLLVVVGVQFLTTGILGELVSRTFFAASNTYPYALRPDRNQAPGWRTRS